MTIDIVDVRHTFYNVSTDLFSQMSKATKS
jgi:hypothetical protein